MVFKVLKDGFRLSQRFFGSQVARQHLYYPIYHPKLPCQAQRQTQALATWFDTSEGPAGLPSSQSRSSPCAAEASGRGCQTGRS